MKKSETFFRRLGWAFSKSGIVSLAFEHFLAMIPATILVPILINNTVGSTVVDVSLALFTSGVGTILFTLFSGGKIPAYVGSSFAFIGLSAYLVEESVNEAVTPQMAYSYVGWGYLFSGFLLIALSFLYKKKGIEKFLSFLLPPTIVGPAISLIGLELSDTAVADSGFDVAKGVVDTKSAVVAVTTLCIIIVFSLVRRKFLRNSSIIIGVFLGFCLYLALGGENLMDFKSTSFFAVPRFSFRFLSLPPNLPKLFFAMIPATFIVFTENIGRVTVISRMTSEEKASGELFSRKSIGIFRSAVFSHGVATVAAALMGSVPNTLYAENIAVMGIHKDRPTKEDPDPVINRMLNPTSPVPLVFAACLAMLFAFIGPLQVIILGLPKPVIGGMELFLFGIISAPGIQLLIDQKVNYKKTSNQLITAAVLISGVSGLSIDIGFVDLKGMSLGFVVGIVLNLLVQFIKLFGRINDAVTFDEVILECLSVISPESDLYINNEFLLQNHKALCRPSFLYRLLWQNQSYEVGEGGSVLSCEYMMNVLMSRGKVELMRQGEPEPVILIKETANGICIDVDKNSIPLSFSEDTLKKMLNDYEEALDSDDEVLHIYASRSIPLRKIRTLIQTVANRG